MQLLHVDSAITGDQSVSRQLTARTVAAWQAAHPGTTVQYLDLAQQAPSHLSAQSLGFRTGQAAATEVERNENALSEALVSQFLASDVIVIGAPLYNFSIPSQLKAWIDLVSVAGVTFRYGPNGAEGMLEHKRAIIVATAGGQHAGQPSGRAHADYLRLLLAFLGVSDVRVIAAEGLAMGPAVREPALAAARGQVAELAVA